MESRNEIIKSGEEIDIDTKFVVEITRPFIRNLIAMAHKNEIGEGATSEVKKIAVGNDIYTITVGLKKDTN
jgi:hypothetical protein